MSARYIPLPQDLRELLDELRADTETRRPTSMQAADRIAEAAGLERYFEVDPLHSKGGIYRYRWPDGLDDDCATKPAETTA